MANKVVHLPVLNGFGQTLRKDNWWAGPLVTFIVLASFVIYATFRAFEGRFYAIGPYLSPLASPYFETKDLGIPFVTPAILILPFPGLFRFTCYYYRKAYYRSFAMTPPACAVGAARIGSYNGEYFALMFLVFLWHDFIKSLSFEGHVHFGLGCLVIFANCTFLSLYTMSCHSFRHLIGGNVNSYSEAPFGMLRHKIWNLVSKLNTGHMSFAWVSLFGVALCDFYIRSVASGAITDIKFF